MISSPCGPKLFKEPVLKLTAPRSPRTRPAPIPRTPTNSELANFIPALLPVRVPPQLVKSIELANAIVESARTTTTIGAVRFI